jgi:hypothetical protein
MNMIPLGRKTESDVVDVVIIGGLKLIVEIPAEWGHITNAVQIGRTENGFAACVENVRLFR